MVNVEVSETRFYMEQRKRAPVPRRRAVGESRKTERLPPIYVAPADEGLVLAAATAANMTFSDFAREALDIHMGRRQAIDAALESFRVPMLGRPPAGPWREAIDEQRNYVLSSDVADTLEARKGDIMIEVDGESMEGAGIPNGSLLLLRPLQEGRLPRRGQTTLVQILRDGEVYESTVKTWIGGEPVVLHDGNGHEVQLPEGTIEVRPVAVARGMITQLY